MTQPRSLSRFAAQTGIPVGETQAGKSSLPFDHPQNLGAIGVTGTPGANIAAREADLVIAVGTRLERFHHGFKDRISKSRTFASSTSTWPRLMRLSMLPCRSSRTRGLRWSPSVPLLPSYKVNESYASCIVHWNAFGKEKRNASLACVIGPPISQGEVIGVVNRASEPEDVVVCAAGSLPGDLHKLWRARTPNGYHLEYGYSCMGYEIAGGLGVKMAHPDRQVYVMVGDGSFLLMSSEIVTSIQEGYKLNIVLLDNHGFSSIGGLSNAVGSNGFGTDYRYRTETGQLDGEHLPVDFVKLAEGYGAKTVRATTHQEAERAIADMRKHPGTTVVVIEVDKEMRVPGYESWWDVPMSEVSEMESIRSARAAYEDAVKRERHHEIAVA